ncbi:hypothetical protein CIB48_g5272 [Xylaria polymorpha]|nr:hypothetical protein CIB48_g5272 [Xylaria polymorpha]
MAIQLPATPTTPKSGDKENDPRAAACTGAAVCEVKARGQFNPREMRAAYNKRKNQKGLAPLGGETFSPAVAAMLAASVVAPRARAQASLPRLSLTRPSLPSPLFPARYDITTTFLGSPCHATPELHPPRPFRTSLPKTTERYIPKIFDSGPRGLEGRVLECSRRFCHDKRESFREALAINKDLTAWPRQHVAVGGT